jgi:hypothetical protein
VPRISYVDLESLDPTDREIVEYGRVHSTPRPESHPIRDHVPAVLHTFTQARRTTFLDGVPANEIEELCRSYESKSIALTSGRQRWIETLGIGHRQVLGDTDIGLAPPTPVP